MAMMRGGPGGMGGMMDGPMMGQQPQTPSPQQGTPGAPETPKQQ
jgi:hypothetical protein